MDTPWIKSNFPNIGNFGLASMTSLHIYLHFNGHCAQAFDFYKLIFGGHYDYVGRYKDLSQSARANFPFCHDDHIMHMTLQINKDIKLIGGDLIQSEDVMSESIHRFSLLMHLENKQEADRIFYALSEDGDILVPIEVQFWGSYYGQCVDKFGVSWKISCP